VLEQQLREVVWLAELIRRESRAPGVVFAVRQLVARARQLATRHALDITRPPAAIPAHGPYAAAAALRVVAACDPNLHGAARRVADYVGVPPVAPRAQLALFAGARS